MSEKSGENVYSGKKRHVITMKTQVEIIKPHENILHHTKALRSTSFFNLHWNRCNELTL